MKILIVTQRYWPESFSITDIAEELAAQGNQVTVLTGLPNYPEGHLYPGYEHGGNREQTRNGVTIFRVKEIERRHDLFHRFLNYYSFPHFAKKAIRRLNDSFDVVLMNELSPIMSAYPAIKYKKKTGARILMYEMDLWPESLLAGGIKQRSLLFKHYKKVSAKIYSQMDKILVSTKEHSAYIKSLPGCASLDIDYLPQYAEKMFDQADLPSSNNDKTNFMFAGNIGKAQNLDIVIEAAAILKDNPNILFHIVGDGSEKSRLENKARSLSNVRFYGSRPKEEMPSFYANADVMMVTLEDSSYARMTIPGKVQTYMASGKPILSAAKGATNALVLDTQSGIAIESLSPEDFASSCILLSNDTRARKIYGQNASNAYETMFNRSIFFQELTLQLKKLTQ